MKPTAQAYAEQLETMVENARRWRASNSDKMALVQFNFPHYVGVIAPISIAVEKGIVSVNKAGLELLKALWPWDVETEPTVLMVQAVLEKPENPA